MNYMKAALAACLVAILSACATSNGLAGREKPQPQEVYVRVVDGAAIRTVDAADASPNDLICKRERALGSRFYRTVCKARREIEAERRAAENSMRRIQQENVRLY